MSFKRTIKIITLAYLKSHGDWNMPAEKIGPDRLVSAVYQARRMVNRIAIDFYDISVIIGKKHLTARTIMTATATGPGPRGGKTMTEAREIEMRWKKVAGVWKIAEVRFIKILR